jgi:hypothetical protein
MVTMEIPRKSQEIPGNPKIPNTINVFFVIKNIQPTLDYGNTLKNVNKNKELDPTLIFILCPMKILSLNCPLLDDIHSC